MFISLKSILVSILWSLFLSMTVSGQIGGFVIGGNKPFKKPPDDRYFVFPPRFDLFDLSVGADFRLKIKEEVLVFSFRNHQVAEYKNPDLQEFTLKYRFENKQLLRRKYVVNEVIDIGLGLNRMQKKPSRFDFNYAGMLPHLNVGYGLFTSNGSLGLLYGFLLTLPRKYINVNYWQFNYSGYSTSLLTRLELLYYPVLKLKRNKKPEEERRRNR